MATIRVFDASGTLGVATSYDLSFPRALSWLALATSPSPRSRYRPGARWALAKYSSVCDPRRRRQSPFIVNPGIADLDPHQKGVLSDDMGMAIALGLIDQQFGIVGLFDCYAMVAAGLLGLHSKGRHRKMPDFMLELQRPYAGSKLLLLECKGSQTANYFNTQLETACKKQLGNVDTVHGDNAVAIPKMAAATELLLGDRLRIHVSDPPQNVEKPLSDHLRANLLALEYSLFGDIQSANQVWSAYGLPTFVPSQDSSQLPTSTSPAIVDESISALGRGREFSATPTGEFEERSAAEVGYALAQVGLQMSDVANQARKEKAWGAALAMRDSIATSGTAKPQVTDAASGNERVIEESASTSTGIAVNTKMRVWYA